MKTKISGKDLAIELIKRFFTSSFFRIIVNTILPIIISLYLLGYNHEQKFKWFIPVIILILLICGYNIIAEILLNIERKYLEYWDLLDEAYRDHCYLNSSSATKLYRLNKIIIKQLKNNNPIDKSVFDKMADFNTISFDVCNSIYNIIVNKYGIDTECEVTIYRFNPDNNGISMIAYANKNEEPPLTYNRIYSRNADKYLFGKLFKDKNAQIHVCINSMEIKNEFKFLEGSEIREQKICQYIGIPLLTARKRVELLLQIDVSKPNVFGKKKEDVLRYAENIFKPYLMLLNKAYERDLILDGYYEMIIKK